MPAFSHDLKRIGKRGLDERKLLKVIDLVLESRKVKLTEEITRRNGR